MKKENINIAIVGCGYVGLPLAVAFSKHFPVTGYDLDSERIQELKQGHDKTKEISKDQLLNSNNLRFVSNTDSIKNSNIYIITVPTPVNINKVPDNYMRKHTLVNNERYITVELKDYEEKILSAKDQIINLEKNIFQNLNDLILKLSNRTVAIADEIFSS